MIACSAAHSRIATYDPLPSRGPEKANSDEVRFKQKTDPDSALNLASFEDVL